jgi:methionyl-tRNA formyltransferase
MFNVLGTVNIHPSLLPLYRGAAPVQRALQDGVPETGVSLAFTVRKLDAGPVIASKRFQVDDLIKVFTLSLDVDSYLIIFSGS